VSIAPNRAYPALVGTLFVLFATCATALAILMVVKVIGPFRFMALSSAEANMSFGLWTIGRGGIETENRVRAWREVAPRDRPLIESKSLAELRDLRVRSIAIPDARSLGPYEIEGLLSYLASGGGVVLTGSVGVSRPDGTWRGYEQMEALLQVDEIHQVTRQSAISIAAAKRGPLSEALSPRRRIPMIAEPGMPAVDGVDAELHWDQVVGNSGPRGPGASRRVEFGPGRIAWLAAGPESAREGASSNWHPMLRLLRSAIAWSAGLPRVEVLPWPGGAAFAAKIASAAPNDPADTPNFESRAAVLAEIEWAKETGGLLRLTLGEPTTQGVRTPSPLRETVRAELKRLAAWIPAAGEIQRWSRIHSDFRASFRQRGPRRVQIDVTNGTREIADDVVIRLHVNRPVVAADSSRTQVGQEDAIVRFKRRAEWIDLLLPALQPRSSHSYYVDFELLSDLAGNFREQTNPKINGRACSAHVQL